MDRVGDLRGLVRNVAATVVLGLTAMTTVALNTGSNAAAEPPEHAWPIATGTSVTATAAPARAVPRQLPFGKGPILPGRTLVAYYGTAGTGALGVLGEARPDRITPRLRRAARAYATKRRPVQIVYELIVTVADAHPGPDGDFSHDIPRKRVADMIRAAERHRALLVLDLQPGRSDFVEVARRWRWALAHPYVGLALDPEWRMRPHQVPGRVIGSVGAREVNRVSAWLARLSRRHALPQKVFMLHTFRTSMLRDVERIRRRGRLAMIQHVDGFGTPGQKLATYHAVARPARFHLGLKLFYDEDRPRMTAERVQRIRPRVEFVSFQ